MRSNLKQRLSLFDRYLSVWVILCIIAGVAMCKLFPELVGTLSRFSIGYVNLPIAVLVWLMIFPTMLRIDFTALRGVGRRPKGIALGLFINWMVKPFSMALLGWLFLKYVFADVIGPELADQYLAGLIILAAAPCTGMVFVWSYLTDGDPAYTLVQVALNDLLVLFAFVPIVVFLLGVTNLTVPYDIVLYSVLFYVVIPFALGASCRVVLLKTYGQAWLENVFLGQFKPFTITALLATLVIIFAFQGDVILSKPLHIALIAIPLLVQVYFNAGLGYALARWLRLPYPVAAPIALIGSSNFFELAVATAISLFGLTSGATLATVVGVLIEVPVMLSVCAFCNRTVGWFDWESDKPMAATGRATGTAHTGVRTE